MFFSLPSLQTSLPERPGEYRFQSWVVGLEWVRTRVDTTRNKSLLWAKTWGEGGEACVVCWVTGLLIPARMTSFGASRSGGAGNGTDVIRSAVGVSPGAVKWIQLVVERIKIVEKREKGDRMPAELGLYTNILGSSSFHYSRSSCHFFNRLHWIMLSPSSFSSFRANCSGIPFPSCKRCTYTRRFLANWRKPPRVRGEKREWWRKKRGGWVVYYDVVGGQG